MNSLKLLLATLSLVGLSILSPRTFGAEKIAKTMDEKSLTIQLEEMSAGSKEKVPPEKRKVMEDAIENLRKTHITDHALKVGDKMPPFELPDGNKKMVSSKTLLKKGPLIVVFYRGGWCPYCNLQLHDLQKYLPQIKGLGAELVAISPQTPDNSLSTAQKDKLSFYVLSDVGSKVGKKFGLVYKLPKKLQGLYKEFGIDLEKSNATRKWELPLAATYVIKQDGRISYVFLDVDYKKRAETKDLIDELKSFHDAK